METQTNVHAKADPSLASIAKQLELLTLQMNAVAERQRKTEELFEEFTPILKLVMGSATERLDRLEKKGYFAFGQELVNVGERIMEGFTPDDVRQLGSAIVGILQTVREMTQPEVLRVAADASAVLQHADKAEPIGLFGMVRATGDQDVQKGMSVMMELMRHVGRAAVVVREKRKSSPHAEKREKLDAMLGSKRKLGVERPAPKVPSSTSPTLSLKRPSAVPAGPACATPSAGPAPVAAMMDGVGFGADGHLADASTWTHALGEKLAAMQGVEMTDAHWKLVDTARAEFVSTKVSPNIRRLTQIGAASTKDIYALFPKAPARTLAKIAGLPKPAGCL